MQHAREKEVLHVIIGAGRPPAGEPIEANRQKNTDEELRELRGGATIWIDLARLRMI